MNTDSGKHAGDRDDGLAHTFDQTNDHVDGLQGDADDPEKVNERLGEGEGDPPVIAAPPTGGTPQGVVPPVRAHLPVEDEEEEVKGNDPDA
ncbi:hypothetical protein [Paramicrobacterium fandaimingii]|uniref:hypothetical protein n=1 Tax=Paramicrobacterium fandaimingii TaxID=2708079 RepID=UPI0014237501|nr:hypothetical protein [Microbacterium fandaimingii]